MFAIHSPQSITLHTDDGEEAETLVNFSTDGANTSRCKLVIVSKGRTWTAIFNQRGYLVDQSYTTAPDEQPDPEAKPLTAEDYMVDGRDTRANNPYTHVAPVDADTAYRDGRTPGYKAPEPRTDDEKKAAKEDKDLREKAFKDAEAAAKKTHDEQTKQAAETPEQRQKRLDHEREERLKTGSLKTMDDTTKADKAWDAPHVEQSGEPKRNPDGALSSIPPEPSRDIGGYDPLMPAGSSPLPGSPPPHRADSPNPTGSKINTSGSMNHPADDPYRPGG